MTNEAAGCNSCPCPSVLRSPPMGWRSWNAFGANINNKTFVAALKSTPFTIFVGIHTLFNNLLGDEAFRGCLGKALFPSTCR